MPKNRFDEILNRRLAEEGLDKKVALSVYKHMWHFVYRKIHELAGTYKFQNNQVAIVVHGLFVLVSKPYTDNKRKMKEYKNYLKKKKLKE